MSVLLQVPAGPPQGRGRSWQGRVTSSLFRLQRQWPGLRSLRYQRARAALLDQWVKGLGTLGCRHTATAVQGVALDWIWPPGSESQPWPPPRLILYLHGGAFCLRMPHLYRAFLGMLCSRSGAVGLMPDYRLAPAHPHPAAIDDCFAAYASLLESGVPPQAVAFVGDSAGGGLCLSALQLVRKHGLPMPCSVALMSTSGDWTMSGASFRENRRRDALFSPGAMRHYRRLYLQGAAADDPLASPVFASCEGFPPLHLAVAETELLRDVSIAIAGKARAAGVPVELDVWPGMFHAFQMLPLLPESRVAIARLVDFLHRHWSADPQCPSGPTTSS
jgi:acetyl esterase/lipase